jgi:hypothetical protein
MTDSYRDPDELAHEKDNDNYHDTEQPIADDENPSRRLVQKKV